MSVRLYPIVLYLFGFSLDFEFHDPNVPPNFSNVFNQECDILFILKSWIFCHKKPFSSVDFIYSIVKRAHSSWLAFTFKSLLRSPSSPIIRDFIRVAILSSRMIDVVFNPVCLKCGCVWSMRILFGDEPWGILEEIKATTISFSLSKITSAGRNLEVVRSVKGKGISTIEPFI